MPGRRGDVPVLRQVAGAIGASVGPRAWRPAPLIGYNRQIGTTGQIDPCRVAFSISSASQHVSGPGAARGQRQRDGSAPMAALSDFASWRRTAELVARRLRIDVPERLAHLVSTHHD
jgi:electron transfer flavoprotein alpha subunit